MTLERNLYELQGIVLRKKINQHFLNNSIIRSPEPPSLGAEIHIYILINILYFNLGKNKNFSGSLTSQMQILKKFFIRIHLQIQVE